MPCFAGSRIIRGNKDPGKRQRAEGNADLQNRAHGLRMALGRREWLGRQCHDRHAEQQQRRVSHRITMRRELPAMRLVRSMTTRGNAPRPDVAR